MTTVFHALLTRYNLYLESFRERLGEVSLEEWMEHRFPIFRDYCLESIRSQESPPDLWVLGLDMDLEQFSDPIKEAIADIPFARISFQAKQDGRHENQKTTLTRPLLGCVASYDYISTTRMDCDDVIHSSFFGKLRDLNAEAVRDNRLPLDASVTFPNGSVYFGRSFYERTLLANNFVSRLVDRKSFINRPEANIAFAGDHKKLKESGREVIAAPSTHPMWVQNFHDGNLAMRDGSRFKKLNLTEPFLKGVPQRMR